MAVTVLVGLAAATLLATLAGSGSETFAGGRLGGDLPEFYGAGRIVREGDAEDLYEAWRQAASQEDLFGEDQAGYLDFAYPPVVAAAYAPLSLLPYRAAYLLHVGLMASLLWLAIRLVRPMVDVVRERPALSMAGATVFFPLFRAVTGGQNTALTVLCLSGAWRARHDDRDLAAGLWLGLLLFKPQLVVLALVAHVVSKRWRVLAGAAASAGVLWVCSALTMGPGWLRPFLDHGVSVPGNDSLVQGGGSVSLIGTAQRFDGVARELLVPAALLASALVAALCLLAWRRCDRGPEGDLGLGFAVLAAGTVVAAPHVIFYDAGILLLVGLVALRHPSRRVLTTIVAVVVASWLGAFDDLPVNPLGILAMASAAWVLHQATRHGRENSAPPARGSLSSATR